MKFQKTTINQFFFTFFVLFALFGSNSGCTRQDSTGESENNSPSKKSGRQVNIAIWSNYLSKALLADFENQTGIKVNMSHYTSNEELLGKLQAGAALYDLAVPSDYMVSVMSELGLIQPLEKDLLPELKNIEPFVLGRDYDKQGKFSIPYGWGTTGIAYRKDLIKTSPPKSWKDFFDNPAFDQKMSLLDDPREVIAAVLKSMGKSLNSTDPEDLERVRKKLSLIKPRVKSFESDTFNALVAGEVAVAQSYSIDARKASETANNQVGYIFPEEGGTIWFDCLVIPKGSPHREEVYELIRYLLTAKANVERTKVYFTTPVIIGAKKLLPDLLKNDPVIFPAIGSLKKFELMKDLGDKNKLIDKLWTEFKTQGD